jgi:hypothetical protein
MTYLRVAMALVEEKSATAKSVASSSSLHSRSRSNRPAHSNLPTIQQEVDQNNPEQALANGANDGDLRANLDRDRRARDAHDYISVTTSARNVSCGIVRGTTASTPPSAVHHIMEHEERGHHDVENRHHAQYEADYGHPEEGA